MRCKHGEDDDDDDDHRRRRRFLMLLYMIRKRSKKNQCSFRSLLNEEGRKRRDRHLPRAALVHPSLSAWQQMYGCGIDSTLITVVGFDHNAFRELLELYKPYFDGFSPWTGDSDGRTYRRLRRAKRKGRGRIINAESSLGLTLAWFRFRGAEWALQGWFGYTGTHTNVWLRFGRRMLLKCLMKHPDARVKFPTDEEVTVLKGITEQRHYALDDVYCTADGLKLYFESCKEVEVQGMYFNGWQHDHFVSNLLVFSVCGRIISCVVNVPGSIHDSTMAIWGGVYDALYGVYQRTGGKCCVDSAFASNNNDYLIRSAEDTTKAKSAHEIVLLNQATSLRQAAEWGMRGVQSSMPRLRDRIKYEAEPSETGYETERSIILKIFPMLYNFRLELVGLNQLRNTYCPNWSKYGDYYIKI